MAKQFLKILFLFLSASLSYGQSMEEIFRILPSEYTPKLTASSKDSLLQFGLYTIPGGDSIETMKCLYTSDTNQIQLEYNFSTGQSGFIRIELGKFKNIEGETVIVFSKYGGLSRSFNQHKLLTFDYFKGRLILNKKLGLPETIPTKEFLKDDFPDSLKSHKIVLSSSYDLNPEEFNSIAYEIYPQTQKLANWVKTYTFLFIWSGEEFIKWENIKSKEIIGRWVRLDSIRHNKKWIHITDTLNFKYYKDPLGYGKSKLGYIVNVAPNIHGFNQSGFSFEIVDSINGYLNSEGFFEIAGRWQLETLKVRMVLTPDKRLFILKDIMSKTSPIGYDKLKLEYNKVK